MTNFRHFLFFAMVLFSFVAKGQETEKPNFSKGQYIIGFYGSGGFNNSPIYKHPNWSPSPWAGYFVAPNLSAGLRVAAGRNASLVKTGSAGSMTVPRYDHTSLAPEVFLRYYAPRIKIKPFVQVSAGYNFQWGETENASGVMEKVRASNVIGSVEAGICFPIGKRFSIDAAYNWRAFSKSTLNDANEKGKLRLGFSFRL